MAFVQSQIPEEQQNQFSQQGQTTPNPLALVPPQAGGSSGQGGGGGPNIPGVGTPTQFGSGASRLSDYLKANQDQVQNMANTIAGNLGTKYQGLQGSINQAGQTFGQQVAGGYTPIDPSLISEVQSNPKSAASDPNKVSKFQSLLNDDYTGPTSFEASDPYMGVQKNVQDAMQEAGMLGNYSGLSTYLKNNFASNATPGQNTLDTVLLNSNRPAWDTVLQAAAPYSGLSDYLSQIAGQENQAIQDAQKAAPEARSAAQNALQSAVTDLNSGVNSAAQAAQKRAQEYNAAVQAGQQRVSNDVPLINQFRDILQRYGTGYGPGIEVPWADPTKISVPNQTVGLPDVGSVASADQYATLAALMGLSGGPVNSPLNPANAAMAGTWKDPGSVDTSQIDQALQAMQNFVLGPNANNLTVNNNPSGFVNDANEWYRNLISEMGWKYPGSGPYPSPFYIGNPGSPPPGLGGPGTPGGV